MHDGDGIKNLTKKRHRRSVKLHRFWFITLNLSNVRDFSGNCVLKFSITVFKKRKGKSLSCVHILHETWNQEVSRRCRAVTVKKCTKIPNARAKLLFCLSKAPFTRIRFCWKTDIYFLWFSLSSTLNSQRKRTFSITFFGVEIFENVGFSFTCGRTKTVSNSEYDDVIHHIFLA